MATRRSDQPRSGCPINAALEVIADRWSPLALCAGTGRDK
jgi:DNA-binding HxlR family transcriptional regulator